LWARIRSQPSVPSSRRAAGAATHADKSLVASQPQEVGKPSGKLWEMMIGSTCSCLPFRSALWSRKEATSEFSQLARLADLVFSSVDELGLLTPLGDEPTLDELERAAPALADGGVQEIVVRRGPEGAFSARHW